jgi:hypothetical protein
LRVGFTTAILEQLVRGLTFKIAGGTGSRKLPFSVADGDGNSSAQTAKIVNVI